MQPHISQFRLLVHDFPACFRFYRDVVGLPLQAGSEADVYASFTLSDHLSLGLFKRDLMAEVSGISALPAQASAQDTSMIAFEVADLDQAVAELTAKGIALTAPVTNRPDWGMRTAHFRDPDGYLVEIFGELKPE